MLLRVSRTLEVASRTPWGPRTPIWETLDYLIMPVAPPSFFFRRIHGVSIKKNFEI